MHADPDLVRWLFEVVWTGGEIDQLSQRLRTHTFHHGDSTTELHPSGLADVVEAWRIGLPDLEFRIVDLVASGDLVATRCRLTGTHLGPWRGRAPSGRAVDMGVMMFFRFDETGLVEVWELDDMAALERQLEAG